MIKLSELRAYLETHIAGEGGNALVLFGRSHLYRRDRQGPGTANRVVIAPGQPRDGRGRWQDGVKVNVRTKPDRLVHWRWVTVQAWAFDSTAVTDEAAQDDALEALLQCTMRGLQNALISGGGHRHTLYEAEETYPIDPTDRRHGDMAQVVFQIAFSARQPTPTQLITAEPNVEPPENLGEG